MAVIAGNLELAEIIQNYKTEDVGKYFIHVIFIKKTDLLNKILHISLKRYHHFYIIHTFPQI